MVADSRQYNFSSVVEEFFSLKPLNGPNAKLLREMVETRTRELLEHPDVRYMPAFKILDLISDMVNAASGLDAEPQLRPTEASALLRNLLAEDSQRLRQFLLDAALERARYEPMMILGNTVAGNGVRELTLRKRWHAMRSTHQSHDPLPPAWLAMVDHAVERTIAAPNFASYRIGPLMQFFTEMLNHARQLHHEHAAPEKLMEALAEGSPLWKRYALKPGRYRKKQPVLKPESPDKRPTLH